ncbi:MAG TPA: CHAP domain-containing protein [Rhizomicrobium sp.]|nr:CHAP domain-containing protein [Rhizomicrobium sp.]
MVGSFGRLAAAAFFSLTLAGCAGGFDSSDLPGTGGARVVENGAPLECVPYARARSGIQIYGDASTWWDAAAGKYLRGSAPRLGAIMVLTGYAGPHRGHLAVVTAMDSDREIRVDHANWLNDGAIYRDDPVVDVSPDNDWSEVRVWNARAGAWGARTYLVQGFIGPGPERQDVALAD